MAEPAGKLGHDPQFGARLARRINSLPPTDDAAFEVCHRAVFFCPLGDGQHDVRDGGGLGRHHVCHHEEIESGQPRADGISSGRRDNWVRAMDE